MTDKEKKRHDAEPVREGDTDEVSREAIDRTVSEIEGVDPADSRKAAAEQDGHEEHGVKDKSGDKEIKAAARRRTRKGTGRGEGDCTSATSVRRRISIISRSVCIKETDENRKYANEELIKAMIPTVDNLERAITHSEGNADQDALLEGIRMVYKQFIDTLAKFGVEQIASLGKPFDPNLHQALMQVKTNESPPNTVVTEVTKGYLLNGRLIRPSMVGVSVREGNETPQESPWGDEELRKSKTSPTKTTGIQ